MIKVWSGLGDETAVAEVVPQLLPPSKAEAAGMPAAESWGR